MNKKYFVIALLVLLVAVLIGRLLFFGNKKRPNLSQQVVPTEQTIPTATNSTKQGSLDFFISSPSLMVNQPVEIKINGSLAGRKITGFDLLLGYDDSNFDFIKATSLLDDFRIFSFKKNGMIRITAVKSLSATAPTVLENTPLVSISFLPKNRGDFQMEIVEKKDIFETFFTDLGQEKIYPRVNKTGISVR